MLMCFLTALLFVHYILLLNTFFKRLQLCQVRENWPKIILAFTALCWMLTAEISVQHSAVEQFLHLSSVDLLWFYVLYFQKRVFMSFTLNEVPQTGYTTNWPILWQKKMFCSCTGKAIYWRKKNKTVPNVRLHCFLHGWETKCITFL